MSEATFERSPVVFVRWVDSSHANGWKGKRTVRELLRPNELECWSAGLLIAETEDRIVITTIENRDRGVMSPLCIPKCAITHMEILKHREEVGA